MLHNNTGRYNDDEIDILVVYVYVYNVIYTYATRLGNERSNIYNTRIT